MSKRQTKGVVDHSFFPKGYEGSLGKPLVEEARRLHPGAPIKHMPGVAEDWDQHLPGITSMHRYLTAKLEPHEHDYVHDDSVPKVKRAQFLMDKMSQTGASMHWTSQRGKASAEESYGNHEWRAPGDTQIAIHADPPAREHIEDDAARLDKTGTQGYEAPHWEVPLKQGAPVSVRSVRWRKGNDAWTTHRFKDGHQFTAASTDLTFKTVSGKRQGIRHTTISAHVGDRKVGAARLIDQGRTLDDMYVRPEERGRGFGHALMGEVIRQHGHHDIRLHASPFTKGRPDKGGLDKETLRGFYAGHGFEPEKEGSDYMVRRPVQREAVMAAGVGDYGIGHRPLHDGAPAHDLTQGYQEDIYTHPQHWAAHNPPERSDLEGLSQLRKARGKPEAKVHIYRATHKDAPHEVNTGDWVTLSKTYARQHAYNEGDDDYAVHHAVVAAKHVRDAGTDQYREQGYWGPPIGCCGHEKTAVMAPGLRNPHTGAAEYDGPDEDAAHPCPQCGSGPGHVRRNGEVLLHRGMGEFGAVARPENWVPSAHPGKPYHDAEEMMADEGPGGDLHKEIGNWWGTKSLARHYGDGGPDSGLHVSAWFPEDKVGSGGVLHEGHVIPEGVSGRVHQVHVRSGGQWQRMPHKPGFRVTAAWQPTERIFGPTYGLDHRLFDGEHLKSGVREVLMTRLAGVLSPVLGPDWHVLAHVWLAGSQASKWTGPDLEGNGDLDVLIGLAHTHARVAAPSLASLTDAGIEKHLNTILQARFNESHWHPPFDPSGKEYDLTGYVNHVSNIRQIKPYAAYDLTDDDWTVKPQDMPDWSAASFPQGPAVFAEARALAAQVRAILRLPEPFRSQEAARIWDSLHAARGADFSEHGLGWQGTGNVLEKALDQAHGGLIEKLKALKYAPGKEPMALAHGMTTADLGSASG
jgi:GNAT superfamily N-acetyltransferase